MVSFKTPLGILLLVVTIITMASKCLYEVQGKDDKMFLNLSSCHSTKSFSKPDQLIPELQERYKQEQQRYKDNWDKCVSNEKTKRVCAKVCFIEFIGLVFTKNNMIDTSDWLNVHFLDYFGYMKPSEAKAKAEYGVWEDKIRGDLKSCFYKKYPEFEKFTLQESCKRWDPLLSCIEKAHGCP